MAVGATQVGFTRRERCNLCGSEAETLIKVPFLDPSVWDFVESYYEGRVPRSVVEGVDFEVSRCSSRGCEFAWLASILNDRGMETLYSEWISKSHSLSKKVDADVSLPAKYAREAEKIASLVGGKPHEIDVLDFGMGWGYWCRMAHVFGYRVRGFEVDGERIEHARGMGIEATGRFEELGDRRYDFINSEQVFEHIPDPAGTLKSLAGMLRPGGAIRIGVPQGTSVLSRLNEPGWKAGHDPLHPLEHINCFIPASLVALGRTAGLQWIDDSPPPRVEGRKRRLARRFAGTLGLARSNAAPPRARPLSTLLYFRKPS